jgi:hypothetical protein
MGRSAGRRLRVATPARALAVGVLIVVMLAGLLVVGPAEHRGLQLSRLGEIALFLGFGDADRTVAAFAARLQDAVELGTVRADLLGVVERALEPTHLSMWITPVD